MAASYFNMSHVQSATRLIAKAIASQKEAHAIFERLARENPSVIELQIKLAASHAFLGLQQSATGLTAGALASLKQAQAICERLARKNPSVIDFQSGSSGSHISIGALQIKAGRSAEALASFEEAHTILDRLAREQPESRWIASDLAETLDYLAYIDLCRREFDKARSKLIQAIEWQRKALATNPDHPDYRKQLAHQLANLVLAASGLCRADEASEARRQLAELGASATAALDAPLTGALNAQPTKVETEPIQLAYSAYRNGLYASSARLYTEALAKDHGLAGDRRTQHAYNAACAAALAGVGEGEDDPPLADTARAKLRQKALEWLKAELGTWAEVLTAGPAESKAVLPQTLKDWKTDADLAGIRDEKELARLPDEERAAFKQLWKDVDQLLTKAAGTK